MASTAEHVLSTPVHFDTHANTYADALKTLALALPPTMCGVAYRQQHILLLNAVDVLQQVGTRVYYNFQLEQVADAISDIQVDGADHVDVYANGKAVPLTNDVTIVHAASPYTSWKLRLWWNNRPSLNDKVLVSYRASLYRANEKQTLATHLLRTATHSYYNGVAKPIQAP